MRSLQVVFSRVDKADVPFHHVLQTEAVTEVMCRYLCSGNRAYMSECPAQARILALRANFCAILVDFPLLWGRQGRGNFLQINNYL